MVIIITGASSGIGFCTAKYLASLGHTVYGLSRRIVKDENFYSICCDMTDYEQVSKVFQDIYGKESKIDVLVNNAGMGIAGAIEHTNAEEIKKIFDVNVLALINACKTIVPYMRKGGGGKIVNVGSVAGDIPIPFQSCYSATKSAVDMFTMAFGLEVKDFNVKTTCVMPGDTKTGFTQNREKNATLEDENYKTRIKASIEKMEKDETNGVSPLCVSKVIKKVIYKKNPPSKIAVGFSYKFIVFLNKILPRKFMLWVVKKIYGWVWLCKKTFDIKIINKSNCAIGRAIFFV